MRSALRNAARGGQRRITALLERVVNLIQFQLEQLMLRGPLSRLFVIAVIMGLLSVVAGLLVYYWVDSFDDAGTSIWWAFLHLTDSGYLGDDEGTLLRVISTFMTIAGVVLFIGALIAIMTQWLNKTIDRLEQGLTPIAQNNHVLILGWHSRTAVMVEQLMLAEGRVKRFLRRHGSGRLKIVILAERLSPALVQELKDRLGPLWNSHQIILRSGSALRLEHLLRVDYLHAAVILLPSFEFGSGASAPDERTVKTLMTAAHSGAAVAPGKLPLIVTELFDADQLRAARRAYPGPAEMIGTGLLISRLMAQNSRHRGLSSVCAQLLSEGGNQIYIRDFKELVGQPLAALAEAFEHAVLLGVTCPNTRKFIPLYAEPDYVLAPDDRLALIAEDFDSCVIRRGFKPENTTLPPVQHARRGERNGTRRVLLLGWNQKLPALIREFDAYEREAVVLDVVSLVPPAEREKQLARRGIITRHAQLRHIEGDMTSRFEMASLEPGGYDNIILAASDWLDSAEAADARSLLGFLVLVEVLEEAQAAPPILVEALSADNAGLFSAPNVELLVSPDLQSHVLTQVALRRELHWVMEELFGASGAEICFRHVSADAQDQNLTFRQLQRRLAGDGEILLGLLRPTPAGREVRLNPAKKEQPLDLQVGDELIVLDVV